MPTTRRLMTLTRLGALSTTTRALRLRTKALGVLGQLIVTLVTTRLCSPRSMHFSRVRRAGKSARTTLRSRTSLQRCAMGTARRLGATIRLRTSSAALSSSSNPAISRSQLHTKDLRFGGGLFDWLLRAHIRWAPHHIDKGCFGAIYGRSCKRLTCLTFLGRVVN